MTFLRMVLAIFLAPSLASPLAAADGSGTDRFNFRVAALAEGRDEATRIKVAAAQHSVAIIFLPGILGSRLIRNKASSTEATLWGVNRVDAHTLALDLDDPSAYDSTVTADLLPNYRAYVRNEDTYETFRQFRDLLCAGRAYCVDFGYDWRLDIRTIARQFDARLRAPDLKGHSLIIIAHSMGGLVAWTWQSQIYRPDQPTVLQLLLVGAPLAGVCEMARMLDRGYSPPPDSDKLDELLYRWLFGNRLRSAAFTFPSVFELLPAESEDEIKSCAAIPFIPDGFSGGSDYVPWKPYSIDFWRTTFGMYVLGEAWKDLGWDAPKFWRRFERVLAVAKDFRDHFDLKKINVPVHYFYSWNHPTVTRARVSLQDGHFRVAYPFTGDGDGRVPLETAINRGNAEGPTTKLGESHGNLTKDRAFLRFLNEELKALIAAEIAVRTASVLAADRSFLTSFVRRYGGREDAALSSTELAAVLGRPAETLSAIDFVNSQILGDDAIGMKQLVRIKKRGKTMPTVIQLEALAASPNLRAGERLFVWTELGTRLTEHGSFAAALLPLDRARDMSLSWPAASGGTTHTAAFLPASNLAKAYYDLGATALSHAKYHVAATACGRAHDLKRDRRSEQCQVEAATRLDATRRVPDEDDSLKETP